MKRVFAAIKIIPEENFLRIYYGLKNSCKNDKINWVKPENIHITLKFFGEIEEEKLPHIFMEFQGIAKNHPAFKLKLEDVGIFGSSYKPRVIWFGINHNESLQTLAIDVIESMDKIGFLKDRQNFVPHLTIGRIKYIDNKTLFSEKISRLKSTFIQESTVIEFHFYESRLSSSGPVYDTLGKFNLSF
jgi:2'-5' RNA ligase